MSWLALTGFAWSDYDVELAPAARELIAGDLGGFLAALPSYGGSAVLRSPFAGATAALGGGELAVWRAFSIPCLVVVALLAIVIVRRMGARGASSLSRALVMGLFVVNPLTLRALEIGHPEELLCAAFAIGAVLAAGDRRTILAAVLLGLAIATKAWAVLAIGPVLLALPARRLLALAVAGCVTVVVLAPLSFAAISAGTHGALVQTATTTGTIFTPSHLFWFLGDTGQVVLSKFGVPKPDGWRVPPAWLSPLTHPFIAFLVVPLSALWAWVHRAARPDREQLLLLLATLFFLRCLLDPWNVVYYELPFLLALLTWEALTHPERLPYASLGATAIVWVTFERMRDVLTPDMQSVFFCAWGVPLALLLLRATFSTRAERSPAPRPAVAALAAVQRH